MTDSPSLKEERSCPTTRPSKSELLYAAEEVEDWEADTVDVFGLSWIDGAFRERLTQAAADMSSLLEVIDGTPPALLRLRLERSSLSFNEGINLRAK